MGVTAGTRGAATPPCVHCRACRACMRAPRPSLPRPARLRSCRRPACDADRRAGDALRRGRVPCPLPCGTAGRPARGGVSLVKRVTGCADAPAGSRRAAAAPMPLPQQRSKAPCGQRWYASAMCLWPCALVLACAALDARRDRSMCCAGLRPHACRALQWPACLFRVELEIWAWRLCGLNVADTTTDCCPASLLPVLYQW